MKKKNTIILIVILVIGVLLGCIAPIIPVCKVEQSFNLSNGKILERKTSLGIAYSQKIQDTDLLECKFNALSNHAFHRISDEVIQEIGLPMSDRVFPLWQEWLNKEVKKRVI